MNKSRSVDLVTLTNSSLLIAQGLDIYQVANVVNQFLPPALIVLGTFVSILSILVMRGTYFRKVSTSVFMSAGAINDLLGLLLGLLPHWLFVNYSYIYQRGEHMENLCKFFNFYGYSTTDVTLIFTASMTVDRAYAIKFPLRNARVNTLKRARYALVVGLLVVALINLHLLFSSTMSPSEAPERMCVVSPSGEKFQYFVEKVWPWIHIAFLSLCFFFILSSNIVIIVHVKRSAMMNDGGSNRNTMRLESGGSHSVSTSGRLRQMTTMMLAESFTTLLLSCPLSWYLLFSDSDPEVHTDPEKMAMNQLLFSVFFNMLYSNKCINFFLYLVSGYKFRLALKQLLRCSCDGSSDTCLAGRSRGRRPSQISVSGINSARGNMTTGLTQGTNTNTAARSQLNGRISSQGGCTDVTNPFENEGTGCKRDDETVRLGREKYHQDTSTGASSPGSLGSLQYNLATELQETLGNESLEHILIFQLSGNSTPGCKRPSCHHNEVKITDLNESESHVQHAGFDQFEINRILDV